MNLDRFLQIARLVSNTIWVRTYVHSYPGRLVLEIVNLHGDDLGVLRSDLSNGGFRELPAATADGIPLHRFAVTRDCAPPLANPQDSMPGGHGLARAKDSARPAFYGFLNDEENQVDLCFTPSAPDHRGVYAVAYFTQDPNSAAQIAALRAENALLHQEVQELRRARAAAEPTGKDTA